MTAGADITLASKGLLQVSGVLDFHTVPGLLEKSRSLLDGTVDTVVDLSGVTRANSAGLVLLLEWLNEGRRRQRQVRFRQLPEALKNLARVSNCLDLLPEAGEQPPPAPKKAVSRRPKRKPRRRRGR